MYSIVNNVNNDHIRVIDMRSDTVSLPTEAMFKSMKQAKLGDDVYNEDPTVIELETRVAKLFGKESALFTPSGTMANLISIMVHCKERGCEAIVGNLQHIYLYEQGGASVIANVLLTTIQNNSDGTFDLNELKSKITGSDIHEPRTRLVLIENTHNICGGKILSLDWINEVSKICKENNLKLHMDGARIFNASESMEIPISEIVKNVDSISICLSKGLCCPVGSLLIGNHEFINEARRVRKLLGGGMRQVGILASCGLVALDEIVPQLSEDHTKLKKIANAIHQHNSVNFKIDIENVQTNILMIQIKNKKFTAGDFTKRLMSISKDEIKKRIVDSEGNGISLILSSRDWSFARLVVYHQITEEHVELAIKKILHVIDEFDSKLSHGLFDYILIIPYLRNDNSKNL